MLDEPISDQRRALLECMAIEVLKGDLLAARQLIDHLMNEVHGGTEVKHITKSIVTGSNVKAVVYVSDEAMRLDAEINWQDINDKVLGWLNAPIDDEQGRVLSLIGIDRIELYEMTDPT